MEGQLGLSARPSALSIRNVDGLWKCSCQAPPSFVGPSLLCLTEHLHSLSGLCPARSQIAGCATCGWVLCRGAGRRPLIILKGKMRVVGTVQCRVHLVEHLVEGSRYSTVHLVEHLVEGGRYSTVQSAFGRVDLQRLTACLQEPLVAVYRRAGQLCPSLHTLWNEANCLIWITRGLQPGVLADWED
eukprot:241687-Pelagomonas_calceolata.AAC.2